MECLLDENLPAFFAEELAKSKVSAIHVSEVSLAGVDDEIIVDYAAVHDLIIITFDLDFSRILALLKASKPSVITLRLENLSLGLFLKTVNTVLENHSTLLEKGVLATISKDQIRLRPLPI